MIKFGKKIIDAEKNLPILAELFSKKNDLLVLYLFGSRATDTADDLSDIDIAILFKGGSVELEKELALIGEITSILHTDDVSMVILNNAPLVMRYGVIKEAKILYCGDNSSRLFFEEKVRKQYFDFKYYLSLYDNEFMSMNKKTEIL